MNRAVGLNQLYALNKLINELNSNILINRCVRRQEGSVCIENIPRMRGHMSKKKMSNVCL